MDIYEIAKEIREQNNRMTSHPIFQVKKVNSQEL